MNKWAPIIFFALLLVPVLVAAELNFNQGLNSQDASQVDQILSPLVKIYNVFKYAATAIGVIMFAVAGIMFLTAGGEQAKKEHAKNMIVGVVIGLILIWAAPVAIEFFAG